MLPASESSRASWARELLEQAAYLDIHGGTPYPQALALRMSYAKAYFETAMHTQRMKAMESEKTMELAVIGRLDGVIKAIGYLGKALAGRR